MDRPAPSPVVFVQDEVLSLAVRRGFITLAQAQRVRPHLDELSHARDAVEALAERGLISTAAAAELRELAREIEPPFPGYRIDRELGRGGMGVVYEAVQERLARRVALKVVEPSLAPDDEYLDRFEREARTLARLNHPNIVQVYDSGQVEGRFYIALEFVAGEDLSGLMRRELRLARDAALRIVLDAARGLDHAHQAGVIHRDIKPANLLLAGEGAQRIAKVADLGLARSVIEADGELTRVGTIMGTPAYMAPEQAEGQEVDHRADIYALGATLYHALTGARPFKHASGLQILVEKQSGRLPDPRRDAAEVDDDVLCVLDRMIARRPEHRYQDYAALIADLEALLEREPARTPPLASEFSSLDLQRALRPSQRLPREPRAAPAPRRSAPLVLAALALLGLAVFALAPRAERVGGPAASLSPPPASAPATRTLRLSLTPPDARVRVDGELLAPGVTQLELAAGPHRLEASAPGHRSLTRALELREARRLSLHLAPEARDLREDPTFRPTRFPPGVSRLRPLLNLRSKRLDRRWQRLGEWAVRRSREQLAAGAGGLVGAGRPGAPAEARLLDFPQSLAILSANAAPGWRLRWRVSGVDGQPAGASELRCFRRAGLTLVAGHAEGRTYLGRRGPAGLQVLGQLPGELPEELLLDWEGEVLTLRAVFGSEAPRWVHAARPEPGADPELSLVVLEGACRFSDLSLRALAR